MKKSMKSFFFFKLENIYFLIYSEDGKFSRIPSSMLVQCESIIQRLGAFCPQHDMDGIHNVWIVKPGAKSRGRGRSILDIVYFSLPNKTQKH